MKNLQHSMQTLSDHLIAVPQKFRTIAQKCVSGQRITDEEGLLLYTDAELGLLGVLANLVRERKHGNKAFFNKNIHLEPTNLCIYSCDFCAFYRKKGQDGIWDYSIEEMLQKVLKYPEGAITEVHIVGGVHPEHDVNFYCELIKRIKKERPHLHVKGFTAVELDFMIRKGGLRLEEGLEKLKTAGLDSIPGGGAEIFNQEIRAKICGKKSPTQMWLKIHEAAHTIGIPSNATMLYGHIENYEHRIHHMNLLRELQDRTGKFNTFIPLKYKSMNNHLAELGEVPAIEDLRNFAVSRIFMDNVPHLKAYWPMIGKGVSQLALSFGVDDVDGTIDDTTKIYSMAGAEDKHPAMSTSQIVQLIRDARRVPVERDSLYNEVKQY